jgi:hypothetical protein
MTCHYCQKVFPKEALRPYGPSKADICYSCSQDPRYEDAATASMSDHLEGVIEEARRRLSAGELVAIRYEPTSLPHVILLSEVREDERVDVLPLTKRLVH